MDPERWQRLHPLLDRALDLTAGEREAWLAQLRDESPAVAAELEQLLSREGTLDRRGFLDTPAWSEGLLQAALSDTATGVQREALAEALAPRYRIQSELGRGGMATVLRAHDTRHDRDVAIKVIRPDAASVLGAERFLGEIRLTARLTHPNILPLLDSGQAAGALYYVMPLIEGESLRTRLRRDGPLPVDDALRLLRAVLEALDHAHTRDVIHRDIKPDNVLVSGRQAWVADFGIAKAIASSGASQHVATSVGVALGSPRYMAPEQIEGAESIDARADLYAFGVMAWEMLAGRPPFTADSMQQLFMQHLTVAPEVLDLVRPGLPSGLSDVIMRCLAKRPDDRWPNALALLAALDTLGPERPSTVTDAVEPRGRPHSARLVRAILAGSVLFGLAGWWNATRVRPLVLTRPERITNVGRVGTPRLAPDGRTLAWLGGDANDELFVQRVDSGLPRRLSTVPTGLLLWVDDSTLAVVPRGGVPELVDARGGERLPNDWLRVRGGAWRRVPGGGRTLWNVRRGGADNATTTLAVAGRSGMGDSVMLRLSAGETMAWAAGSLELATVVVATLATDSTVRIQTVARDGRRDTVLTVVATDTSGVRGALLRNGAFVPRAGRFAYVFLKRDTLLRVDLKHADARAQRLAVDLPGVPSDMSADGDMIVPIMVNTSRVYRFPVPPPSDTGVRTVSEVSGTARVIPLLSPDGGLLAQVEGLPASRQMAVYLQRPDGNERRRLLAVDGFLTALRWSPDGTKLAARIYPDSGAVEWIVIDTRTAGLTRLGTARLARLGTIVQNGYAPAWSHDSHTVYVTNSEPDTPRELRVFTLAPGDTGRTLSRWWELGDRPRPEGVAVSPDGAQLAVGGASVVVVNIASGATRAIVPPRPGASYLPVNWTEDGGIQFVASGMPEAGPRALAFFSITPVGGAPRAFGALQAPCTHDVIVLASGRTGSCMSREQIIDAHRIRGFR